MKIGFDAKRLFKNSTGLGNYSRDLVSGLNRNCKDLELHLYHPGSGNGAYRQYKKVPYYFHSPGRKLTKYWRRKTIVKDLLRDGIDIYHGLSHELPYGIKKSGIKSVVTMHDMIVKKIPATFKRFDRSIYNYKFKQAIKQADLIVAISESTKKDLQEIYELSESQIEVISPSINDSFFSPFESDRLDKLRENLNLPEKYFLFVGSVIERKNMLRVVEAYSLIPSAERIPFIVLGRGNRHLTEVKKAVADAGLNDLFQFKDNINSHDDLKAHLQCAEALVYPSVYEGFGIPCVEALCVSTPVITSNVSSLPEAAGPDSWLIDPYKPEEIAAAMQDILKGGEEVDQRVEKGLAYAQNFRQSKISSQMNELYQKL
jgi:glycosyltransferase involved in cell wall biosynthesis